ncbi:hypothetical protein OIDMADRAFT_131554 [Oidiodendron maius Zn]|uniref:Uncharacterized protein n=1 Tax=Oidiodendron maius (strain Zn) TaxID=913774 RepID=A0A0C3D4Z4_OIDMZ|nr:hypothetical protein OIDMADRAFT_131554 [Oidiodendron maius Zn]
MIDKHILPQKELDRLRSDDSQLLPVELLRSFGICGMGGRGKTRLAVEWVYTRMHHFDAIFWLNADDNAVLGESFASIAKQLGLDDTADGSDLTVSRERVKSWLARPLKSLDGPDTADNEATWLIVFDNVDHPPVLTEYWPVTGHGSVLITSRDPEAKTNFYTKNHGMDLAKLDIESSIKFIRALTKSIPDSTDGDKSLILVAELLDGLPLAIEQMSSVIRRLRLSYEEFLKLYIDEGKDLVDEFPDRTYEHTLATVWRLQDFSQPAETLLQILSFLDGDGVPEKVVRQKLVSDVPDGFPNNDIFYYKARAELQGASLIAIGDQNSVSQDLSLHRLLQDVARERMDQKRLQLVFETAVRLVSNVWPFQDLEHRHARDRWPECVLLLPQVARLRAVFTQLNANSARVVGDVKFAKLLNDVGWYHSERGFPEESLEYYELVERVCETIDVKKNPEVVEVLRLSHNNRGAAAAETNKPEESLKHFKLWFDMSLLHVGDDGQPVDNYELGSAYHELAVAYAANGEFQTSVGYFITCIEIFEKLPNYKEVMLGWPAPNLGFVYQELDRLDEAEAILDRILKIQFDAFGYDDIESFKTGKVLHALGNLYFRQGRLPKSIELHKRALTQYRASVGNRHARTASVCHRLADHYIREGKFEDAREMLDEALEVFGSRKNMKPELARTTYKKSQWFEAQGDKVSSLTFRTEAFKLYQELVKPNLRTQEEISESDYNKLIIFWNR